MRERRLPVVSRFEFGSTRLANPLLVVVEPGFNSARTLEEARLLISQMSNAQAVGFAHRYAAA